MQPTQAVILQAQVATPSIPEAGAIEQFGLLGIVGFLVVKEALGWFRSKEDAESKLVATLVQDLRASHQGLLDKLFTLHTQQHQDLSELKESLDGIKDRLDRLI